MAEREHNAVAKLLCVVEGTGATGFDAAVALVRIRSLRQQSPTWLRTSECRLQQRNVIVRIGEAADLVGISLIAEQQRNTFLSRRDAVGKSNKTIAMAIRTNM